MKNWLVDFEEQVVHGLMAGPYQRWSQKRLLKI